LGGTNILIETPGSAFFSALAFTNRRVTIEAGTHFSWSVGARATIWECGCFGVGAEFQYFFTRPHLNYFEPDGFSPFYFRNGRMKYREWQVGVGATYQIPIASCGAIVVPYAGVKFAHAQLNADDFQVNITPTPAEPTAATRYNIFNLESRYDVGAVFG